LRLFQPSSVMRDILVRVCRLNVDIVDSRFQGRFHYYNSQREAECGAMHCTKCFLRGHKKILWFGLSEEKGSIAILQAENDCTRYMGTTRVEKLTFVLRQQTLSRCAAGRTGKTGDKFQSV
jgi:hypothetical protein